jgi:DNA-binding MurR/RpiR family transcriptional regulator
MDPTQKNKVISALKEELTTLSGSLKIVARYILDNPADFGLDSIRETARKTEVSTYSLVRMSKRLGFSGYDELREPFRAALVSTSEVTNSPAWISSLEQRGGMGIAQAKAAQNIVSIVNRSLHHMKPDVAERIVDIMFESRNVFLTGVRASYSLAYYFHYVGRMALPSLNLIPRHMNSAIDELNNSNHQDALIVITFAPYSKEVIEASKFAKSRGLRLVLITDSAAIAADLNADEALVVTTATTHFFGSYSGALAVIENLMALLVKRGGKAAQERIESYDNLRSDHDAYWHKKS